MVDWLIVWLSRAPRVGALVICGALAASAGCKRAEPAESPAPVVASDDAAGEVAEAGEDAGAGGDESQTLTAPFLWEVTAPDGDGRGYLFGTMHLGIDADASLPEIVWDSLEAADIFAMEADVADMSVATQLMRDDGTTLSEELGEEAWDELVAIVGSFQARGLDAMKPAAAAMAIIAEPMPATPPMDLVFFDKAKRAELELVFLEEASEQIDLLLRYITTDVLLQLLEDYDEVVEMSERGLAAYYEGDAEALSEFLLDPANWEASPEGAKEALLDDRNEAWLPQIEALLARGTPFVAVGAGHLIGEGSVVELLESGGYEVRRVDATE